MNVTELSMKNYRSYKDETIVFDKDFYTIVGAIKNTKKSNGSGKSSIVSAVCDALYGTFTDEDIHNDKDEMELGIKFKSDKEYTVIRKVKRGKTGSIFIKEGADGDCIKYAVKTGQQIINRILGADYTIFKNTSYFQQRDLDSFSKLTPKEAKTVVINLLQLDIYNKYEKAAKERGREVQEEATELKISIRNAEESLEEELQKKPEQVYKKADLFEEQAKLEDIKFSKQLSKFLANSKKAIVFYWQSEYEKQYEKVSELNAEISAIGKRLSKLESLHKNEEDKYCPTCECLLEREDLLNIINNLKQEAKPFEEALRKNKIILTKIKDQLAAIDKVDIEVSTEYDESQILSEIAKIKEALKAVEKDKKRIKNLQDKITEYTKELSKKNAAVEQYSQLQKAFGRNGIQAYVIENVIPEIQMTANDILKGLDTHIRISLNSQKELKKGGTAETLDISVITEYGERPYSKYSGGEKTLIDFSLRMALSVILARRSNCQIQTLILDEVFGELDSVNKRMVSKALRYISKKFNFKKILVISHSEELQESFDNVIRVKFDGKVSHIKKEEQHEALAGHN